MKALTLHHTDLCLQKNYPRPIAGPDEALVRVRMAGICGTDLELVRGYAGFSGVLGHELVGVIEESPDPRWVGQRIVASINIGCGTCRECSARGPEHCPRRSVLGIRGRDGSFAELIAIPCANLHAVPDHLEDDEAVFAEPLAAALRVGQQVDLESIGRAAVVGPGRLGLLVAQVLAPAVDRVVVVGRSHESLELPRALGLETTFADEAGESTFDLVVDTSGSSEGLLVALRLVRSGGTVAVKSTFAGEITFDPARLVVPEVTLIGSRCGSIPAALELLAEGSLELAPLIDGRYSLDHAVDAMRHAARRGVRKILIEVRGDRG